MKEKLPPDTDIKSQMAAGSVLICRQVRADSAEVVGSKAARLAALQETVGCLPPWYVVTAPAFEKVLRDNGLLELLGDVMRYEISDAAWHQAARELNRRIMGISFSADLRQALVAAHDQLFSPNAWVAVRSSATPPMKSGLCKTFVFIRRRAEIDEHILKVWASAFSPEAVAWRRRHHLPAARPHLAVLVQEMVDATTSGVVYTAHPESGDPRQLVIRSLLGNGKALGDPAFGTDEFRVDKEDMEIYSTVGVKNKRLILEPENGGLREVPVGQALQTSSSLRVDDVVDLARLGILVENHFGRPQTVNFALDAQEQLAVLEVVDMGDVREYGPAAGNPCQWDTAELFIDRVGRLTPLQFSVCRRLNELAGQAFALALGVSAEELNRQRRSVADMRGRVHGHLYANLDACRSYLESCATADADRESVAAFLGLSRLPAMELLLASSPSAGTLDLWTTVRTPPQLAGIIHQADDFQGRVRERLASWRELPLRLLPPSRLISLLYQVEDEILGAWAPAWCNDYHAFCGAQQVAAMGQEAGLRAMDISHWHVLLDDEFGAGIRAALDLMDLADIIRRSHDLLQILMQTAAHEWFDIQAALPRGQTGYVATRAWMKRHGHLPTSGYGPDGVAWLRHPAALARLLRAYVVRMDEAELDPVALLQARRARRSRAEEAFAQSLSGAWLTRPRAVLQRTYVDRTREALRCAQAGRMLLCEVWGWQRDLLEALGYCLAREALLASPGSVTYLTLEEVKALFNGSATTTDLEGLIDLRRREGSSGEHSPPPAERAFYTYGIVHHRNRFAQAQEAAPADSLRGIGCECGSVTGRVRWMSSPLDALPERGEIIAAESLDAGWVPLLPLAAGVLVQRGHDYSFPAIMARELGVPMIMGIRQLTRQRIHGWQVDMNGTNGMVHLRREPIDADRHPGKGG